MASNEELNEFYKFWQSLGLETEGSVIRPFMAVTPTGHSTVTSKKSTTSTQGVGLKLFSIQEFELLDALVKNHRIEEVNWPKEKIQSTVDLAFKRLDEPNGAEDWLQLMLTCKYYFKNDSLKLYNEYIAKTEDILYISKKSTQLKEKYNASKSLQLIFNIQRVHAHFAEGNIEQAEELLNDLVTNWMDVEKGGDVNLLYQGFIFYLCTNNWEKAILNLKKMWQIINLMSAQDKHSYGAWDNWICCLILCWYFALYNQDFNVFISKKLNLQIGCLLSNRKIMLVTMLTPAQIKNLLPDEYYDYACKLNESLPKAQ